MAERLAGRWAYVCVCVMLGFVWLTTPLVGWTHVISEREVDVDWTALASKASVST